MEDRTTSPEALSARRSPKVHRVNWIAAAITGMVSSLATSLPTAYFSYKSAKVEADTNKIKAEVGYQTLVDAVKKHEEHDMEQDKWIFKLEGHVESLETSHRRNNIETGNGRRFSPVEPPRPADDSQRSASGAEQHILSPSNYKGLQLPETLDSALEASEKK